MISFKNTFKNLPIKHKLIAMMMLTSSLAIVLISLLVIISQVVNRQTIAKQELTTLADVIGSRSTGALIFDDLGKGEEALKLLTVKHNIIYAEIRRANGEVFAVFGESAKLNKFLDTQSEEDLSTPDFLWRALFLNKINVTRNIYVDEEKLGEVRIISTLDDLCDNLLQYILMVVISALVCFVLCFWLSYRLQKIIAEPILHLQEKMNYVVENNNYSLRITDIEEVELKDLADDFNHILHHIQAREHKLTETTTFLDRVLETRDSHFRYANEKRILWLESMSSFLKHELKNLSVGIKSSLDLIERRTTDKEKIDIYLKRANKSMDGMSALLQTTGDASNLEISIYKEEQSNLDLGGLIMNHIDVYDSTYPDVEIKVDCQQGLNILGNEPRLIQLLDKLISNAVEHHTPHTAIEIVVQPFCNTVQLIVSNQGVALPKNKQEIFDLFVSLRAAEQKTEDNFGLGLYIVKLIVESHGGKVKADDYKGITGAVFEVTLPLKDEDAVL